MVTQRFLHHIAHLVCALLLSAGTPAHAAKRPSAKAQPPKAECKEEWFDDSQMLLNGKLPMPSSRAQFEQVFGKPDPEATFAECGVGDDYSRTITKDGSTFHATITNTVEPSLFVFTKKNFITYKGVKLTWTTTAKDLKKLFPCAMKNSDDKNPALQLKQDAAGASDGHTAIEFVDGKLHAIDWWFPC